MALGDSTVRLPLVVGMGGAGRDNSSTERALRFALAHAEQLGARTLLFAGVDLDLPNYRPEDVRRLPAAERLISALREADGVIIASPGYHGGISGLVKNALDYVEEMRQDQRPYFDGRAVGCLATAAGWQGAVVTLSALRSVAHALRGWPTPVGVAINSAEKPAGASVDGFSEHACDQMRLMVEQILRFSRGQAAAQSLDPVAAEAVAQGY
ncbi:MAG: NAD(P)H-dependent oxidoreductase [Caulobacteraceae bacterium]|nr:NAD(P)H-dependent oxidoreductase [Caulobacteraceae bacterium]